MRWSCPALARAAAPCFTARPCGTLRSSSRRRVVRAAAAACAHDTGRSSRAPTAACCRLTRRVRACAAADCRHPEPVLYQPRLFADAFAGCETRHTRADLTGRVADPGATHHLRRTGPIAPRLSLFYFFDYSAISAHSLMGWCVNVASKAAALRADGAACLHAGWSSRRTLSMPRWGASLTPSPAAARADAWRAQGGLPCAGGGACEEVPRLHSDALFPAPAVLLRIQRREALRGACVARAACSLVRCKRRLAAELRVVAAEHHWDDSDGGARVRLLAAASPGARSPRCARREWLCLRKEMRDIPLVRHVFTPAFVVANPC